MKSYRGIAAVSSILAAAFQGASATPTTPGLTYLGTANISLAPPIRVGTGPRGDRNVFAIISGSFDGPSVSATIPGFGGDWGYGDPTLGNFYVDARYQLHTADGADIIVEANGPQQPSGEIHTRVKFETGHPDYYWLNDAVAISIVSPGAGVQSITIDVWFMTTPP